LFSPGANGDEELDRLSSYKAARRPSGCNAYIRRSSTERPAASTAHRHYAAASGVGRGFQVSPAARL